MTDLDKAIERAGSVAALAQQLGVAASTVRSWRCRGAVSQHHRKAVALAAEGTLAAPPPGPEEAPVELTPPGHRMRGVSTLVDAQGRPRLQWVKTSAPEETREAALARLLRELPTEVPVRARPSEPPVGPFEEDLLAVYVLGDPHVGMLAWAPESGADWDLRIAEETLVGAVEDLVERGPRTARAIVLNCGDFFHADNIHGHTSGGSHTLDLDGRTPKVLGAGMRIFVALVDAALRRHDHVTVDVRIGNHDGMLSLMLAIAIAAHYRHDTRVSVPLPVSHRSYHVFGKCLVGTTHGDKAKGEDLAHIMAAERPEAWGNTKHRYWYVGHVHHSQVKEYPGVKVESFRTLAARDAWHAGMGYLSGRDAHRIVLHRHHGEISREIVNADAVLGVR